MTALVNCDDLLARKQKWNPIESMAHQVPKGAEETIGRCLALRNLEIPVGDFIEQACSRDLPVDQIGMELLRDNVQDEQVHDRALQSLATSLQLTTRRHEQDAQQFLEACLALEDHPISTARVLEVSVFFCILPIFRYLGNPSSRAVSADISRDERIHVETNTRICDALRIQPSKKLKSLRREIVAWMTDGLNCGASLQPQHQQYGDQAFWLRQSDNLLNQGRAPELRETRRSTITAFFESDKRIQPDYAPVSRR